MADARSAAPWARIAIMLTAIVVVAALSLRFTGSLIPDDPKESLVFQNALLLIVLGSALLEHHYTKPADSVVNSLMGIVTLISVFREAPRTPWLFVISYCTFVFVISIACVTVSSGPYVTGWKKWLAAHTYRPSVVFGQSRVLFTVVFLAGLWFFYEIQDPITIALILFWGVFIALWPLRIPELITAWFNQKAPDSDVLGAIVRIDSPNILRVALDGDADWSQGRPSICTLPNGKSIWVQPLYAQFQDGACSQPAYSLVWRPLVPPVQRTA